MSLQKRVVRSRKKSRFVVCHYPKEVMIDRKIRIDYFVLLASARRQGGAHGRPPLRIHGHAETEPEVV